MSIRLVDPKHMTDADWPGGAERVRAYVDAFAASASERLIANVRTRVLVLLDREWALPVTVNTAEYANSYVCSPYNAYVEYATAELHLLPNRRLQALLARVIAIAGAALKAAHINRAVVVNNWLLSTNLYPRDWQPDVPALTAVLTRAYPDHAVWFRSLNRWTNPRLTDSLLAGGYRLLASRQVYAFDRLDDTWRRRSDVRHDLRLLGRSPYRVVQHDQISAADYARAARLYDQLYRQKYPAHNPAFTADYIGLCHRAGVMRFVGLRTPDGRLDGILGLFGIDDVVSAPIVGYDTTLDRRLGLYRLLMLQPFLIARATGSAVNLSAGAASFKRLRGGRPVIESSAIYDHHLARPRQLAMSALARLVNGVAVPLMQRLEL